MDKKIKTGTMLNVLSLEDSAQDFEVICIQLTNAGFNFNISRVEKEKDFVSSLQKNKYDIILSDFNLPSFDGFEALRLRNEICPDVPFICVSGSIGEETAIDLIKLGAVDYVLKENLARLPSVVERALDEAKEKKTRQLAEEALTESEEKFSLAFRTSPYAISITHAVDGGLIDFNNAFCSISGYTRDEVLNNSTISLNLWVNKDDRDSVVKELMEGKKIVNREFEFRRKNGEILTGIFSADVINIKKEKLILSSINDITERKLADDALESQHALLAALINSVSDIIIFSLDRNYRYTAFNEAHRKEMKRVWNAEINIGMNLLDYMQIAGLREMAKLSIDRALRGEAFSETQHQPEPDIYYEFTWNPIFQNNEVVGVTVFIRDITERKRAESELKFRNLLLSTQQETSIDGILVVDGKGHILSYNRRFIEMWSLPNKLVEEKVDEPVLQLVAAQMADPLLFFRKVQYLYEHTNETSYEEVNLLDGRCFERYSAPMIGADGIYYGRIWYFHDITKRKQTEEELSKYREHLEELVKERTNELARERNLLRTLIDSLPDEIYAKDMDSRFIIANSHVINSLGRTNINEIIGKTDFEIMPQTEAMKYYRIEHAVLYDKGQMINYEISIQNADGNPRWYSITKVPMRNGDGNITGLVGINRDITYFKESEERLEKAKIAAEAANLAKSTFLSNMSHEIRTPLNAILGFSELMQSDKDLSKEHVNWLKTINRSGEHLLALINDILEISRIEAGRISFNPATFDIHTLLRDIEAMFRVKTDKKNLSLLFEYSDELPRYIVTDEGKLRQIIINLVGNAVKFTKEGGVAFRARVKNENDKMHFNVEVEDTGPGIAQKDMDKLFQKFGQTEAGIKEGGTGLGLAISQQYAKIMGGEITLRSKEGKGTCFILTIEFENSEILIKKENNKKQVIGLKPGQKLYRILVADDRTDNRELLKIILTSVGFKVEEAQNGNEVIAKFKVWSPDLILMDMRMPVMDGYEATRRIRAMKNGKIRIIAVTASAFQEDMQKSLDAGADAYLRKPFKEHELFESIGSCLGVKYVYE